MTTKIAEKWEGLKTAVKDNRNALFVKAVLPAFIMTSVTFGQAGTRTARGGGSNTNLSQAMEYVFTGSTQPVKKKKKGKMKGAKGKTNKDKKNKNKPKPQNKNKPKPQNKNKPKPPAAKPVQKQLQPFEENPRTTPGKYVPQTIGGGY